MDAATVAIAGFGGTAAAIVSAGGAAAFAGATRGVIVFFGTGVLTVDLARALSFFLAPVVFLATIFFLAPAFAAVLRAVLRLLAVATGRLVGRREALAESEPRAAFFAPTFFAAPLLAGFFLRDTGFTMTTSSRDA